MRILITDLPLWNAILKSSSVWPRKRNKIYDPNNEFTRYIKYIPFDASYEHFQGYMGGPIYVITCEPLDDRTMQVIEGNEEMRLICL